MTQRRMIHDMLDRFGLSNATQVSTPIDPNQVVDSHPHAKAVSKLMAQLEQPDLPLDQRESIESKISHLLTDGELLGEEDKKRYMQIVGAVQYLATVTRADIAYASGSLARFMCKPTRYLLKCAERHLRYLKGTTDYGLVLDGSKDSTLPTIMGYADSDHQRSSHRTTGRLLCTHVFSANLCNGAPSGKLF